MNIIGKNIRGLRQKNGWSQGEVAKQLRISTPAFSKIETGITDINLSRLQQIANLFNVDVLDIICVDGDHPMTFSKIKMDDLVNELSKAKQEIIEMQRKLINMFDENKELVKRLR